MASVNFKKFKTAGEAKAMMRHGEKKERLEHEHSNKDIDKERTRYNVQMKRSYAEACRKYDERIAYLDSLPNANKRKDRVTCFGLNVPVPLGLPSADTIAFFNRVYDIISAQYGEKNIMHSFIHRDEVHGYIHAETHRDCISRVHGHFYVVPEHDGKLNGKWFSKKSNMVKLNNSIHEMARREFGVDFMDGSKRKSTKTVEQLKNESANLALQRQFDEQKCILEERARLLDQRAREIDAEVSARVNSRLKRHEQAESMLKNLKHPERGHEFDYLLP